MAKRGGTTGKSEEFISFTPSAGFDIRKSAAHFSELMEDTGQPLVIQFPNIAVEFEPGCTRKQIIDGYNQALKAQVETTAPSNNNKKGSKKGK